MLLLLLFTLMNCNLELFEREITNNSNILIEHEIRTISNKNYYYYSTKLFDVIFDENNTKCIIDKINLILKNNIDINFKSLIKSEADSVKYKYIEKDYKYFSVLSLLFLTNINWELVEYFIDNNIVDIEQYFSYNYSVKTTLLNELIIANRNKLVIKLLDKITNINKYTTYYNLSNEEVLNKTPLDIAIEKNNKELAEIIKSKGGKIYNQLELLIFKGHLNTYLAKNTDENIIYSNKIYKFIKTKDIKTLNGITDFNQLTLRESKNILQILYDENLYEHIELFFDEYKENINIKTSDIQFILNKLVVDLKDSIENTYKELIILYSLVKNIKIIDKEIKDKLLSLKINQSLLKNNKEVKGNYFKLKKQINIIIKLKKEIDIYLLNEK